MHIRECEAKEKSIKKQVFKKKKMNQDFEFEFETYKNGKTHRKKHGNPDFHQQRWQKNQNEVK